MRTYLNMRTKTHGTETVDEIRRQDFASYYAYWSEVLRLVSEYRLAGMPVYTSSRACRDWDQVTTTATAGIKRLCRLLCRTHNGMRVEIVRGDTAPQLCGSRGYWTTLSGRTIVSHPSAYGWPTRYHCSTEVIRVGERWLQRRGVQRAISGCEFAPPSRVERDLYHRLCGVAQ